MHGMKRGVKLPLSNQGPSSDLGASIKCPSFQPLNIIFCGRFQPPPTFFKQLVPIIAIPIFRYIFSKPQVF